MSQTMGFELECYGLTRLELERAVNSAGNASYLGHFPYHGGPTIDARRGNVANAWKSENDSSLRGLTGPNNQGHEVISPILHGVDGMTKMRMVCDALRRAGAEVNTKCGVHVTLGINDSRTARMSVARRTKMVGVIIEAYDYFWSGICTLVPKSRRDNHNCYRPVPYGGNFFGKGHSAHYSRVVSSNGRNSINTSQYIRGGRIEFRQHGGSLNGKKITNWSGLMVALIRWAKNDNHPNFGCDLRDFPPTLEGLLDMLVVGSDLRAPLEARSRQTPPFIHGVCGGPRQGRDYADTYRVYQETQAEVA